MEKQQESNAWSYVTIGMIALTIVLFTFALCSCTLSMANISTHGQAEDIFDEVQEVSPDVSPTVSIPAI